VRPDPHSAFRLVLHFCPSLPPFPSRLRFFRAHLPDTGVIKQMQRLRRPLAVGRRRSTERASRRRSSGHPGAVPDAALRLRPRSPDFIAVTCSSRCRLGAAPAGHAPPPQPGTRPVSSNCFAQESASAAQPVLAPPRLAPPRPASLDPTPPHPASPRAARAALTRATSAQPGFSRRRPVQPGARHRLEPPRARAGSRGAECPRLALPNAADAPPRSRRLVRSRPVRPRAPSLRAASCTRPLAQHGLSSPGAAAHSPASCGVAPVALFPVLLGHSRPRAQPARVAAQASVRAAPPVPRLSPLGSVCRPASRHVLPRVTSCAAPASRCASLALRQPRAAPATPRLALRCPALRCVTLAMPRPAVRAAHASCCLALRLAPPRAAALRHASRCLKPRAASRHVLLWVGRASRRLGPRAASRHRSPRAGFRGVRLCIGPRTGSRLRGRALPCAGFRLVRFARLCAALWGFSPWGAMSCLAATAPEDWLSCGA
jgi:hypothetical protein